MNDPLLLSTMHRHPDWHVVVHNPEGSGKVGTTACGFISEYEDAIQSAKAEAWEESHDHCTSIGCVNPYV